MAERHNMKLKITKTKKTSILYVQKAYRDKNGKSTSRIHERLGTGSLTVAIS